MRIWYNMLLVVFVAAGSVAENDFNYSLFLDPNHNYLFQWNVNETHITIEVQVKTLGWIGFGLSPNGGMTNADIAIMWIKNGKLTLQDRFSKGEYEPEKDINQDWIPLYARENETHSIVSFSRLLDTCDSLQDRKITNETTQVIYAYHSRDPRYNRLIKHEERGSRSIYLIHPTPEFVVPEHTMNITIVSKNFNVPANVDTFYWCSFHKIENITKTHHIIAVQPTINPGNEKFVHHMILHLCEPSISSIDLVDLTCYEDAGLSIMYACNEFLAGWAVGGTGTTYPENIGHPIGVDMEGRVLVLETHYDNPEFKTGVFDSSGLVLYLTDKLRPIESSGINFGIADFSWGVAIPPGQSKFTLMSYNYLRCFSDSIPYDGLYVFNYMFHTHLLGRKVKGRIIRNGVEVYTFKDDTFDFNYQETRSLTTPFKIKRGDYFITECEYNSEDRDTVTIGGKSTRDEMCLIYLTFYPKSDLTRCLTFLNTRELANILDMPYTVNGSIITQELALSYLNSIDWTNETKITELQDFYLHFPQYQYCPLVFDSQSDYPFLEFPSPKYIPLSEPNSTCVPKS